MAIFPYTPARKANRTKILVRSLGWKLQPDVDARCFPVVGFVQNIGATVAVEIRNPGFVKADPCRENSLSEFAFAVAVENPGGRVRIIGRFGILGPFGHFGGEDVEVAVAVDVGDLKAVAVEHVALE